MTNTKWSYTRLVVRSHELGEKLDQELAALGGEGWELVTTVPHDRHGNTHDIHLIFKRPRA